MLGVTDSTSIATGSLTTAGGLGASKKVHLLEIIYMLVLLEVITQGV